MGIKFSFKNVFKVKGGTEGLFSVLSYLYVKTKAKMQHSIVLRKMWLTSAHFTTVFLDTLLI